MVCTQQIFWDFLIWTNEWKNDWVLHGICIISCDEIHLYSILSGSKISRSSYHRSEWIYYEVNRLVWNDESLNCNDGKMEANEKIPISYLYWKQAATLRKSKTLGQNSFEKIKEISLLLGKRFKYFCDWVLLAIRELVYLNNSFSWKIYWV